MTWPPPNEFYWINSPTCVGLFFGMIAVALVVDLPDGRCRVTTNPSSAKLKRVQDFVDFAAAREYVDAWARQWDAELREHWGWVNDASAPVPGSW